MKNPPTLSIGIPAFNEENNIVDLLEQLGDQIINNGNLEKVIVVSDGSTDGTVALINYKSFFASNVEFIVIEGKQRKGKAERLNQIISSVSSDILVLFDADISLENKNFIDKLIYPLVNKETDFTSSAIMPMKPRTVIEKVLDLSMRIKGILFDAYKDGNNIYHCHGPARAFNKEAYNILNFKQSNGEDMYSYLACIQNGFKFKYVREAVLKYRLPSNLNDHLKQSTRFISSENQHKDLFSSGLAKEEFSIPLSAYVKATFKALPIIVANLIYVILYIAIYLYAKVRILLGIEFPETWETSSTKVLKNTEKINTKHRTVFFMRKSIYILLGFLDSLLRRKNPMVILCYHSVADDGWRFNVRKDEFTKQMDHMLSRFTPIDIDTLVEKLMKQEMPEQPSFMITFDDGYKNLIDVVEILKRRGIDPVLFAIADRDNVERDSIKTDKELLSDSELIQLKDSGWSIQSHGHKHEDFCELSFEDAYQEAYESKKVLTSILSKPVNSISYPHGRYKSNTKKLMQEVGYISAFSLDDRILDKDTDIYAIPRVGVDNSHTFSEFRYLFSPSVIKFRGFVKNTLGINFV